MSSGLPRVSDSHGAGRRKRGGMEGGREVRRCVGPRWKVDSWPFYCYCPDFLFFVVFALPASHLQILRVGVTTQTTANDGLDASSGGGLKKRKRKKNAAVRGLRTSIVSFV